MRKCTSCGLYTLKDACPKCGRDTKTRTAHPPSFSPQDKYGKYRRKAKLKKAGQNKHRTK